MATFWQQKISKPDNGTIANGIKKDDLESVFELLKEDFLDLKLSNREIPYATQYELAISIPNRQKLTVNLYEEKKKISISGRQEDYGISRHGGWEIEKTFYSHKNDREAEIHLCECKTWYDAYCLQRK